MRVEPLGERLPMMMRHGRVEMVLKVIQVIEGDELQEPSAKLPRLR